MQYGWILRTAASARLLVLKPALSATMDAGIFILIGSNIKRKMVRKPLATLLLLQPQLLEVFKTAKLGSNGQEDEGVVTYSTLYHALITHWKHHLDYLFGHFPCL